MFRGSEAERLLERKRLGRRERNAVARGVYTAFLTCDDLRVLGCIRMVLSGHGQAIDRVVGGVVASSGPLKSMTTCVTCCRLFVTSWTLFNVTGGGIGVTEIVTSPALLVGDETASSGPVASTLY